MSTQVPVDTSMRLLVTQDLLAAQRRDRIDAWVRSGGTLVVTDPASPLHDLVPVGAPFSDLAGATNRPPGCPIAALDQVGEVRHADWTAFDLTEQPDAVGCFAVDDDAAWLVSLAHGDGWLTVLGSPDVLTNRLLDEEDNAVLAAGLLGPSPGSALRILARPAVGEGDTELLDLVEPAVWSALGLLLLAAAIAAVARGRRLGRPVAERLPPVLPSAELSASVGDLLHRVGDRDAAAARLRAGARAETSRVLGVSPGTDAGSLVGLLVERTGIDPQVAERALRGGAVPDDDALLAVAADAARVRTLLRRGHREERTSGVDQRAATDRPDATSTSRPDDGSLER